MQGVSEVCRGTISAVLYGACAWATRLLGQPLCQLISFWFEIAGFDFSLAQARCFTVNHSVFNDLPVNPYSQSSLATLLAQIFSVAVTLHQFQFGSLNRFEPEAVNRFPQLSIADNRPSFTVRHSLMRVTSSPPAPACSLEAVPAADEIASDLQVSNRQSALHRELGESDLKKTTG